MVLVWDKFWDQTTTAVVHTFNRVGALWETGQTAAILRQSRLDGMRQQPSVSEIHDLSSS